MGSIEKLTDFVASVDAIRCAELWRSEQTPEGKKRILALTLMYVSEVRTLLSDIDREECFPAKNPKKLNHMMQYANIAAMDVTNILEALLDRFGTDAVLVSIETETD